MQISGFPDVIIIWRWKMQKKVLIVEDEFLVALNLKRMLTKLGFETVGIAPDMDTAMALAEERPDIALVDVNLRDGPTGPKIGAALTHKFGASVLFVTANPRQLKGGEDGAVGVLSKPFNDNEIGPVLEFLVQCHEGQHPPAPPNVTLF